MPTPDDSNLSHKLVAYLGGDLRAGAALYKATRSLIIAITRKRSADLRNDLDDVVNEVFVLMMEAPHRFDPARGSARAFILAVLMPEAIQRVRAKMTSPGVATRRRNRKDVEPDSRRFTSDQIPDLDTIPARDGGSPQAMEAACDAHVIWDRATPPMKVILGGMIEGKTQSEIAARMGIDRFRVVRMIAGLQRDLAAAA